MTDEYITHPYGHLCGWKGADATQRLFARQFQPLRQMARHLFMGPPQTEPVLLYKAYEDALGGDPIYPSQAIGDCTGFGHGHANDLLQCIEIGLGANLMFRETDTEFIYSASRQVAGILAQSDGSYGAAAVKAMTSVGMVSRKMLGADGAYSGQRAQTWGRTGPPAPLIAAAAAFKLGRAALVTSWDELVASITHGYPTSTCCDQGFTLERDAQGFAAPSGKWGHCMLFAAVRFDRPGACVLQSWGPDVPAGPTALGQPSWSFWADRVVVEAMLAEGDSWAMSAAPAFESRTLPARWRYSAAA